MLKRILMCVVVLGTAMLTLAARAQDLVGLYLTWGPDPATTMTVNWVDMYLASPNTLYYRPLAAAGQPPAQWTSAEAALTTIAPSSLQRRSMPLTGLTPDTTYELAIARLPEKPTDPIWRFRTMPATLTRPIRFVTGGDMMHTRELLDPMNKRAAALDPDFAVLGGDLAYEDGARASRIVDFLQSWMRYTVAADRRLIPIVQVIGNHEVRGGYNGKIPTDAPFFYGLFSLPEGRSYHAIDLGSYLSFIVLDSGHTNAIDGPQAQWLESALAARTGQQLIFPVYHYPAYGTAKAEEGKTPPEHPRSVMIQKSWVSLFERFGVSAVFENDHHTFKRTHPIRNNQRDDATGITYVGDGAWGVRVRDVPKPGTAWWLAKAESRNHLWSVDIVPDSSASPTVTLRAIDAAGVVFDEYVLPRPRTLPVAP
jgi:hypothetical protein